MTSEQPDLEATYHGYERSGRAARWSGANPGNQAIHEERNAALESLLHGCARRHPVERLLEVGCGSGALLEELARLPVLAGARCTGVDLLAFRLAAGAAGDEAPPMAQADGRRLPFGDARFDVVVLATVLSSVHDDAVAHGIASETDRVLRPGGSVLWYDMRYPNPSNRSVQPLRRARISALFPGYEVELSSVTVIPQLARRLGSATGRLYRVLAAVPILRSHLVGRVTKPG